jgi:ATP-dependent exoDNAse (exonuclease V) beta subunit
MNAEDGPPTVMRGVVDLIYRSVDGWRIIDYKTDQSLAVADIKERYARQVAMYLGAWRVVTSENSISGALFHVRSAELISVVASEQPAQEKQDDDAISG